MAVCADAQGGAHVEMMVWKVFCVVVGSGDQPVAAGRVSGLAGT